MLLEWPQHRQLQQTKEQVPIDLVECRNRYIPWVCVVVGATILFFFSKTDGTHKDEEREKTMGKNALLIPISITYYSLDGLCASQFKIVSGGYARNKTKNNNPAEKKEYSQLHSQLWWHTFFSLFVFI